MLTAQTWQWVMVVDQETDILRINARSSDAFDVFHLKHYVGPNPYLKTAAYTFDFALTGSRDPLPLDEYREVIGDRYPHLLTEPADSYAHFFGRVVAQVGQLEMDLHLHQWACHAAPGRCTKIAVQTLHARTTRAIIYCVWDWFEAITTQRRFWLEDQLDVLQGLFRQSVYGGPTVYALLKTADQMGIPTFYLWDEGLMQYGYGKKLVRGTATTFDGDSHLDSEMTTRKDDCKAFLKTMGFPVPQGEIVYSLKEAFRSIDRIGYPVAVKPVVGHKGIGVTASVRSDEELEQAFDRAVEAIPPDQSVRVIVEESVTGKDYRLLCVNGRFVAATERRPASVTGDGDSTIQELIDRENQKPERADTPTSPMGQIKCDTAMDAYLDEQGLSLDSVLERDRTVYLRKVANLSAGGLSIDATPHIHPDNIILAQDIAQHFKLICLGIDVIAADLSQSWKEGSFGILEINAAPGVYMHLRPAMGESVDVPSYILKTFFNTGNEARIPIISCNRLTLRDLQEMIDYILLQHPDWTIGGICQEAILINRSRKNLHPDYNTNLQTLLRNPKLDLLIAEYPDEILQRDGMFYYGSNLVILDDPTETELMLSRDALENARIVTKQQDQVTIQHQGLIEQYEIGPDEPFSRVYLKEMATML